MQIGMIGLGRMGANMVRRLIKGGHECVVFDMSENSVQELVCESAVGASDLRGMIEKLATPRAVWLMVPAAAVDQTVAYIVPLLEAGDTIINGGNSYYVDDIRRAKDLARKGIHYVDVGTSGGVWGLERGYCLMIGGEEDAVERLDPIFRTLGPGAGELARTPGRAEIGGTAEMGYLHCSPTILTKWPAPCHNGIEYGLMAAYAEGFAILRGANAWKTEGNRGCGNDSVARPGALSVRVQSARCSGGVAARERGRIVATDLTTAALTEDPALSKFPGRVSDSGEGRWTINAAIDEGVPAPVLTAALFERFSSRGDPDHENRLLLAMRYQFGGHVEKKTD